MDCILFLTPQNIYVPFMKLLNLHTTTTKFGAREQQQKQQFNKNKLPRMPSQMQPLRLMIRF